MPAPLFQGRLESVNVVRNPGGEIGTNDYYESFPDDLKAAITESMTGSEFFNPSGPGRYAVKALVQAMQLPGSGSNLGWKCDVTFEYTITEMGSGRVEFRRSFTSSGEANFGEAFSGTVKAILAIKRSFSRSIQDFLGGLTSGNAPAGPALASPPQPSPQQYQPQAATALQYAPLYARESALNAEPPSSAGAPYPMPSPVPAPVPQYAPQPAAQVSPPAQFVKTGEKLKVGVLEFTNVAGISAYEAQAITDMVRMAAGEVLPGEWYLIMTRESILQLLPPDKRDLAACEGECEVETGRNIGADYIVTGEIGRFGTDLQVKFKMYNTKTSDYLGGKIVNAPTMNQLQKPFTDEATRLFEKLRQGGR